MKKVLNLFEILILGFGIILLSFIFLQNTICKETGVLGFRAYVIVTNSMEPKIKVGDIILVKKVNPDKLKKGDTISYLGTEDTYKNKIIAHNIIEITKEDGKKIFYTQGINSMNVDPAVYEEQIIGKVIYRFIILSFLSHMIRSKVGFFIVIFIPILIILIFEFISFIKNVIKLKKEEELDNTVMLELPKLKKEYRK